MLLRSPASANFDGVIDDYLKRYDAGKQNFDCLDAQLNLENVSSTTALKNVSTDSVFAAATSPSAHKALARKLERYRDEARDHGYDGALAYRQEGDQLAFYSVAAFAPEPVHIVKLPLAALKDELKVNAAICKVLVKIPVNAEP